VAESLALFVAIVAGIVAVLSLAVTTLAWRRLSRLRSAQSVLLGGERKDLVDFAVSLQGRIDDLHRAVDEVAAGLSRVDRRVDGAIMNTAVVRYDAYEDTGGQQSASFAFLDSTRTGTVVTAIQGSVVPLALLSDCLIWVQLDPPSLERQTPRA